MSEGERRLAAIMFTDIVGYTALTQNDEALALSLLEDHRRLLRPVFAKHRGREIKTIGDAFLVEFSSALEATLCAVEMQNALHEHNLSAPKELLVRIGIHVGDVIERGQDVLGDAVNIASRIESLAKGGEICISEQVYAQVRNKVPFRLTKLDPRELKNVSFSIEVYRLELPWEATGTGTASSAALDKRRIAVLPFANMSSNPEEGYFADGITEELITALSWVKQLTVIARTSVTKYKGSQKGASEIGKELSVGTLLEGSVRKAGNRVRITVQLIDTGTEGHLWAANYDRQLEDIFAIQSEIAEKVAGELKILLVESEKRQMDKKATESSVAYVKYLRGRAFLHNRNEEDLMAAKKLFEEAISEDEGFAMAYVGLADATFLLGEYYFIPMVEARRKSGEAIMKALSLDGNLAEARTTLANFLQHDYKFADAVKEYELALSLNPNYALAHHWYMVCLWEMGMGRKALEEIKKAEALDPLSFVIAFNVATTYAGLRDKEAAMKEIEKIRQLDPDGYYGDLATAYTLMDGSTLAESAIYYERVLLVRPSDLVSLAFLGMVYGLTGQKDKAREVISRLEQIPDGTYGKPFQLGLVYGGLGEKDRMFELLEAAYAERSLAYRALIVPRKSLGIDKDSRYLSLLSRVGLSEPQS